MRANLLTALWFKCRSCTRYRNLATGNRYHLTHSFHSMMPHQLHQIWRCCGSDVRLLLRERYYTPFTYTKLPYRNSVHSIRHSAIVMHSKPKSTVHQLYHLRGKNIRHVLTLSLIILHFQNHRRYIQIHVTHHQHFLRRYLPSEILCFVCRRHLGNLVFPHLMVHFSGISATATRFIRHL